MSFEEGKVVFNLGAYNMFNGERRVSWAEFQEVI